MFRNLTSRSVFSVLAGVLLLSLTPSGLKGIEPSARELLQTNGWVKANFVASGPGKQLPPFSFVYDGKPSHELLKRWQFVAGPESRDDGKRRRLFSYIDRDTGLEVTSEVISYDDFPAAEWVLHFKNTGRQPTPILQDVKALDMTIGTGASDVVLHYALGSDSKATDFSPVRKVIRQGGEVSLAPVGGRSSDTTALPFFNLAVPGTRNCQKPDLDTKPEKAKLCDGGVMIGLGWSGQWAADFVGVPEGIQIRMGMERTHLKLLPGEQIRTPRMLLLFWQGNQRLRGHNLLRSFLLALSHTQAGRPDAGHARCVQHF